MRTQPSILILTLNEEINIVDCLRSVAWCDDVVVLDSGSTDRTVELALAHGARVVHRPFDNWSSHQTWALRNIEFRHEWVFNLDADERFSEELADEVNAVLDDPGDFAAFRMRRKDYLRGVWLKHATFYPTWLVRLYRPERVSFERLVNPVTNVDGKVGELRAHIEHWPFSKGATHWLERHNSYSSFEAMEYLKRPEFSLAGLKSSDPNTRRKTAKALFSRLPFRPFLKFLYLYVFHRGFLDRGPGLDYCLLQSFYEYMIALKVKERRLEAREAPAAAPAPALDGAPSESPMKIVFFNQFFWPDLAATSQLLTDLTRWLAAEGHDVTVVCASSSYAGPEDTAPPPVRVVRVPNLPFLRTGKLTRLTSYLTYFAGAFWHSLTLAKADIVVVMTTPPLLSVVGALAKRFRGARFYIWEMDMYPDIAVDLKVLRRNSPATRILGWIADGARRRADGVIAVGECMKERLVAHGVPGSRIHVAENWADGSLIRPEGERSPGPLTLLYPGNLGLAHDIATISGAMAALKDDSRFWFVFVGGGANSERLRTQCLEQGVGNAAFLPYRSRKELSNLMSSASIGLVTQLPDSLGSLVPSKVYSLLAAGLPVLFVGPRASTSARAILRHDCGWQIECGDVEGLTRLLLELTADPARVAAAGARAREAFLAHYDTPAGVRRVGEALRLPA